MPRTMIQLGVQEMNWRQTSQFLCQAGHMMKSSNGNIFRVTGPLCGKFTSHRWIPHTKASNTELWWFLWSGPEPTVEQAMETPVIWDAIVLIMTSSSWSRKSTGAEQSTIQFLCQGWPNSLMRICIPLSHDSTHCGLAKPYFVVEMF